MELRGLPLLMETVFELTSRLQTADRLKVQRSEDRRTQAESLYLYDRFLMLSSTMYGSIIYSQSSTDAPLIRVYNYVCVVIRTDNLSVLESSLCFFDEHCPARQCSSLLCPTVYLSVRHKHALVALRKNGDSHYPGTQNFLGIFPWTICRFVLKNQDCGLQCRWQGAKNFKMPRAANFRLRTFDF